MMVWNRKGTILALLGALPPMVFVAWWMGRAPYPGSEGGRGPLTAPGLYAQAVRESQAGDRAATERHLRMALDLAARADASPRDRAMERRLRIDLVRVLVVRGAVEDARVVAGPVCTARGLEVPELFAQRGLCDPAPAPLVDAVPSRAP